MKIGYVVTYSVVSQAGAGELDCATLAVVKLDVLTQRLHGGLQLGKYFQILTLEGLRDNNC